MAVSQVIFDLASRREYIQPMRDEIEQVIKDDGYDLDEEGFVKMKKTSFTKLRRLDSFLKESQRLSPPGMSKSLTLIYCNFCFLLTCEPVSHRRITTSDLTFSTGHTIPKGTRIGFNAYGVQISPSTTTFSPAYNPASYKPPSEFDGFRFYNLRNMEGKENKHQFVATSSDSLNFGHGLHACPGRFFASNEIKVVMVELLRHWDFRLKGDVECVGGADKRPPSMWKDLRCTPNMEAEIEFKKRRVVTKEE